MPWLAITRADHGPSMNYPAQLGMITTLAAASCWCYAIPMTVASISLVEGALRSVHGFWHLSKADQRCA